MMVLNFSSNFYMVVGDGEYRQLPTNHLGSPNIESLRICFIPLHLVSYAISN